MTASAALAETTPPVLFMELEHQVHTVLKGSDNDRAIEMRGVIRDMETNGWMLLHVDTDSELPPNYVNKLYSATLIFRRPKPSIEEPLRG